MLTGLQGNGEEPVTYGLDLTNPLLPRKRSLNNTIAMYNQD
jgi:hypothetical protein